MFLTTNDQSLLDLRSHDHRGVGAMPHIVPPTRRQCNVIFCVCKGVPPSPKSSWWIVVLEKQSQISFRATVGIRRNSHSRRFGWQRRFSFLTEYQLGSQTCSKLEEIGLFIVVDILEWYFVISLLLIWPCIMWYIAADWWVLKIF